MKYNPSDDLCSSLMAGQHVCCSSGTLPDFTPQPNADGSCKTYLTVKGDSCSSIGATNGGLSNDKLEGFNKETWGWAGCDNLGQDVKMCLSEGSPPMPAPLDNAVCGPQVPGTEYPDSGANLSYLNPCPLNACCNIWGQCGITGEFCTDTGTGAPGTAKPGTNGCISNCGTEIVNNGASPSEFRKIAYFEAFNVERACLRMDVTQVDNSSYTHIHYAFGDITEDFKVDISAYHDQFIAFSRMTGIKRILSFGGWGFSTEPSTYKILRNGVTEANRETLAANIANFIKDYDLDGVDIDWEYPGAPDIPGIPGGSPDEGDNYAEFLKILKDLLPDKSVAIAAPASFWYLKNFPIEKMSQTIDYIVFMTYDLHGQWDYGSNHSIPDCAGGNCVRSHVNMTETHTALSMITKAGVSANKIVVGVSSYGRSFEKIDADCTGFNCKYTGPSSGATPGSCTDTAGYLANAEINQIIDADDNVQQFKDDESDSNILVYNNTQWVAYMDGETKKGRISKYQGWNFGGVSDWAVDLQKAMPSPNPPSEGSTSDPDGPNAWGAMDPYLEGCSDAEAQKIHEAWREAAELAQTHYEWVPGGKWQSAMDLYMGKTTKSEYSFFFGKGRRLLNIERQYKLHYSGWGSEPLWTYGYFYCDSQNKKYDTCKNNPKVNAYTWDDLGWTWSAHKVVFCKNFFNDNIFKSLEGRVEEANGDPEMQRTMSRQWRAVRARTLLHETYHWKNTVSQPKCDLRPEVYNPGDVVALARNDEGKAGINAESYAQAAMAIYLQKTFHLDSPPEPYQVSEEDEDDLDLEYSIVNDMPTPVPLDAEEFKPDNSTGNLRRLSDYGRQDGPASE
ncbi:glycoside hydrolase superfamily [Aspergillus aurantiobrunneus]